MLQWRKYGLLSRGFSFLSLLTSLSFLFLSRVSLDSAETLMSRRKRKRKRKKRRTSPVQFPCWLSEASLRGFAKRFGVGLLLLRRRWREELSLTTLDAMGFVSRKIVPKAVNMCVCCPSLHPSSRRPTKRYKKLLADIFPKSADDPPSERKIIKLCEYAAKNPVRIPKIAMKLEQRCKKELRSGHVGYVLIVAEAYGKLLYICKGQMVYFARILLDVVQNLLHHKQQDEVTVLGCQTLTMFIYSQTDSTYAHNIEEVGDKVCQLARETIEHQRRPIRAASLKSLAAMIWYMTEYSLVFSNFDEIVYAVLDSYVKDEKTLDDPGRQKSHWVDEVVRNGGRSAANEYSAPLVTIRRPEMRVSSLLTRKEDETPEVLARICIQKLVGLAKETPTMRRVLEPLFSYFDSGKHWNPQHGLAMLVLSDVSIFLKGSGNEQLILSFIIRHLDHKSISHDPAMKAEIFQIATYLAQQLRFQSVSAEISVLTDLCRHLKKSLQATVELVDPQDFDSNVLLQNSIQDCLLEIAKGVADTSPIFDMMAIALETLPQNAVVARATMGSLLVLAHIISLASVNSHPQMIFPDALLLQLLNAMLHPDIETRIGAHQLFWITLVRNPDILRHELDISYEGGKYQSRTTSVFASATALLVKLRREKEYMSAQKYGNDPNDTLESINLKTTSEEDTKHSERRSSPPYFYRVNYSVIEKAVAFFGPAMQETNIIALSEDQTSLLLSVFWTQAIQTDNLPLIYKAVAHSISWALVSSRLKNSDQNNTISFFQLFLSLMNASLDTSDKLPPSNKRSLFILATASLAFAGKIYHISGLMESLDSFSSCIVDPYLRIGDDMQLYVRADADLLEFGSASDQQAAISLLVSLRSRMAENEKRILDVIVRSVSSFTDLEEDELYKKLSMTFMPDDEPLFCPNINVDWKIIKALAPAEEALSLDVECVRSSVTDADFVSESSAARTSRSNLKLHEFNPSPHVISVGQLLESALQAAAGQVAATVVSTSPLPYSAMANHCEALGMGARKKLSNWLGGGGDGPDSMMPCSVDADKQAGFDRTKSDISECDATVEAWPMLRLPPASPFDNFMKAAGF